MPLRVVEELGADDEGRGRHLFTKHVMMPCNDIYMMRLVTRGFYGERVYKANNHHVQFKSRTALEPRSAITMSRARSGFHV